MKIDSKLTAPDEAGNPLPVPPQMADESENTPQVPSPPVQRKSHAIIFTAPEPQVSSVPPDSPPEVSSVPVIS